MILGEALDYNNTQEGKETVEDVCVCSPSQNYRSISWEGAQKTPGGSIIRTLFDLRRK